MSHTSVALLLAALTVLVLAATAPQAGLTWDEPAYIGASESYAAWLGQLVTHPAEALRGSQIELYWSPNHEHPPLDKAWSGLVWAAARPLVGDLVAHRLGNILLTGVLVAVLYSWVASVYGQTAGLAAAAALLSMPRFFFHAHLAALDVPAAVAVVGVTALFWKAKDRPGWLWTLELGLAWGAAMATKINAVFVLPVLFVWALIFQRRLYLFIRLAAMAVIGIPFMVALWPWLYYDTWGRFVEYLGFVTVNHWEIGQWYLGRFYMPPPWHFSFVMVAAVVPLTVSVLYLVGAVRVGRDWKKDGGLGWLLILSALAPLLALASGRSMVYDGERLFMPAFPFLAALAGVGFEWVVSRLQQWARQRQKPGRELLRSPEAASLAAAAAALVFLPHTLHAASLYPHLLSYYSEGLGGLPGATRLGLETTYWCETFASALGFLNANAQPGDVVWVEPWSHDVMVYYQLRGYLRPDVKIAHMPGATSVLTESRAWGKVASYRSADWIVFQYRQSYFGAYTEADGITPAWLDAREPAYRSSYWGVPLMEIYARDRR